MTTPVQPGDIATDLVVPKRGDPPAIFTPQYQKFLDRMNGEVVPSMNALSAYFNESNTYVAGQVALAEEQVTLATEKVALATEQASKAEDAANQSAASSNFVGEWSGLSGALAFPSSVYHDGNYWINTQEIPDVTASEPSMTNPDYLPVSNSDIRFKITTPFTITRGGKYFIDGSGDVTLPDASLLNGESFSFIASISSSPKIYGFTATDIETRNLGTTDFIEIDNTIELVFIHNPLSGKLEV